MGWAHLEARAECHNLRVDAAPDRRVHDRLDILPKVIEGDSLVGTATDQLDVGETGVGEIEVERLNRLAFVPNRLTAAERCGRGQHGDGKTLWETAAFRTESKEGNVEGERTSIARRLAAAPSVLSASTAFFSSSMARNLSRVWLRPGSISPSSLAVRRESTEAAGQPRSLYLKRPTHVCQGRLFWRNDCASVQN